MAYFPYVTHIDKFPPFLLLLFSKWPTFSRFAELSEDDIYHFCEQQQNVNLLLSACCSLDFVVNAYF